jgi:non-ribosomal peptide synthetase component E (peptide arylation enzyme)
VTTGEEPGPRLGAVRDALGRSLAPYKLPDELHMLRPIPRTPLGKVDGARLRALLDGTPHLVERRAPPALSR